MRLLLCAALAAAGCSREKPMMPQAPAPVSVGTATQKTVPIEVRTIGNVEAFATASVKAQVTALIVGVHFENGQDVKKGEKLFTLDARPFEAALAAAEGALARDEARLSNAEQQVKRYAKLLKDGVAAPEGAEQIFADAKAFDGVVRADRAAVAAAKLNVEYCRIVAPFDGRASDRMVDIGNTVRANDLPVLVTIRQVEPIYVTFTVPEKRLAELRRYQAGGARLKVAASVAGNEQAAEGELTFVDNEVDAATGTIRLKATFANKDRRLWPGQFVDVLLTLAEQPNAIVVPSQAVQAGQQGVYVYVVKTDMTAELRVVKAGRTVNGEIVIEEGVAAGETVVTDGHLRVTPGGKVELKKSLSGKDS
jgi:multidrug efflux system membrane fusion protein